MAVVVAAVAVFVSVAVVFVVVAAAVCTIVQQSLCVHGLSASSE